MGQHDYPHRRGHATSSGGARLDVLHVTRRFAPFVGGTERYVRDLAVAQAAAGHHVTVLTIDRDVTGRDRRALAAAEVVDGFSVRRVPGYGSAKIAFTSRPDVIAALVRRSDVTHLHDVRFALLTVAVSSVVARRPWILHTHGLVYHDPRGRAVKRAAMAAFAGPLLRAAGAWIVASSESDRQALLRDAPYLAARVVTYENAIPLAAFENLSRRPVAGRILVLGRVVRSKRIDDLLVALGHVAHRHWQLLILGDADPAEARRLVRVAESVGIRSSIRVSGRFDEAQLMEALGTADLAVFPSAGEGFGLALLEAMAAGVPTLARDIPAHRSLLGEVSATLLVDFGQPAVAGRRIEQLLAAPPPERERLSRELRARARLYSIDRLVLQIESLYGAIGAGDPQPDSRPRARARNIQ